ncbi:hypothetical protein DFJ73DRAFT_801140 [Zopfochytrium polystomum]|nr:hypothetical protein DFJ73DRAFT_801140 [Zopfochytrium polystomum]
MDDNNNNDGRIGSVTGSRPPSAPATSPKLGSGGGDAGACCPRRRQRAGVVGVCGGGCGGILRSRTFPPALSLTREAKMQHHFGLPPERSSPMMDPPSLGFHTKRHRKQADHPNLAAATASHYQDFNNNNNNNNNNNQQPHRQQLPVSRRRGDAQDGSPFSLAVSSHSHRLDGVRPSAAPYRGHSAYEPAPALPGTAVSIFAQTTSRRRERVTLSC